MARENVAIHLRQLPFRIKPATSDVDEIGDVRLTNLERLCPLLLPFKDISDGFRYTFRTANVAPTCQSACC